MSEQYKKLSDFWRQVRPLAGPALALEAILLALFAVTASCWLGLSPSPITGGWRRWQIPAGWNPSGNAPPGHSLPSPLGAHLLLFALVLLAAAGCAAWAMVRANNMPPARTALAFVLGAAAVLGLTLALLPALPSDDIFSYILYGRIGVLYHANPLIVTPAQFPHDPFLQHVYWQNTRAVYGPAWLLVSTALTLLAQALGGSLAIYALLYKLLGLACHLACAALIWGILARIAPARRLVGTVLYAWNPLALLEFAASGHNDALMLLLFLVGLWLILRGQHSWGMVAWGAAIATKYMVLLLVPLWLWHAALQLAPGTGETSAELWQRRAGFILARAGIIVATVLFLIVPFWAGPPTFGALAGSPPAQQLGNSLMDSISWPLRWLATGLFHIPAVSAKALVINGLRLAGTLAFLAVWLTQLLRSRVARCQAPRDLDGAWGWILLAYLVLASGWYWPWYATWLLAVVALREVDRLTVAALLLAAGSLALYGFLPLMSSPIFGFRSIATFGPALLYLGWMWWREGHSLAMPKFSLALSRRTELQENPSGAPPLR